MESKLPPEGTAVSRPPRVAGIILAAGTSSPLGSSKLLLPFRGKTVLENVVNSALRSPLYKVVVVLGQQAHAIRILLAGRAVALVQNPEFESGPSSSFKAGLLAVGEDVDAVLFLPGDQPLITPELIDTLLTAYSRNQSPIVAPVCRGERGNPALFDRQVFQQIHSLAGDIGIQGLLSEWADQVLEVPVADSSIHFAINTQKDYLALLKMEQSAKQKMLQNPEIVRMLGS